MKVFVGWMIIVGVFGSFSMALLWPAFRLLRRSHPQSPGLLWAYVVASGGCGVTLWYVIPLAVYEIFGRTSH
jgi:hypothetical protein